MNNGKKGISLVALIITIIVLIILTGAVILTMNQGNTIEKSREAVLKSDISNFQEELRNNILTAQLNKPGFSKDDVNISSINFAATGTETGIKDWIPSATEKYNGSLSIAKGNLIFIPQNENDYNAFYAEEIANAKEYGIDEMYQTGPNTIIRRYRLKEGYQSNGGQEVITPLPKGNLAIPYGVTVIDGYAFYNNNGLTSITIPNSVKEIWYGAFFGTNLTEIVIPDSVINIGNNAFNNISNNAVIYVKNNDIKTLVQNSGFNSTRIIVDSNRF